MKNILFIVLLIAILLPQNDEYGGGPNAFYKLALTPRETAMGGTGVASATGPFASLWNPANIFEFRAENTSVYKYSLAFLTRSNLMKGPMYYRHDLISHNYDFNAMAVIFRPERKGWNLLNFGFSVLNRYYKNIIRTSLNINNQITENGNFNISETLFLLTPALSMGSAKVGTNLKIGYQSYAGVQHPLYLAGMDFGFQYGIEHYLVALKEVVMKIPYMARFLGSRQYFQAFDFGGSLFFDKEHSHFSQTIQIGSSLVTAPFTAMDIQVRNDIDLMTGTYDVKTIRWGTEITIPEKNKVQPFLRGGADSRKIVAIGGGVNLSIIKGLKMNIDFSYTFPVGFNNEYNYNLRLVDVPLKMGIQINWKENK